VARVFLVAGLLGGFTTFSAFSLETVRLVEDREIVRAALYALGSVALPLAAALLGIAAGLMLDG
jgi:CrcB protein